MGFLNEKSGTGFKLCRTGGFLNEKRGTGFSFSLRDQALELEIASSERMLWSLVQSNGISLHGNLAIVSPSNLSSTSFT
jgi:hypothetical protein